MEEKLIEASIRLVMGMTGVFSSLVLLAGVIWLMRSLDEWVNARRIRRYAASVEASDQPDELNDEIVAVISAAAALTLRRPVRVRRVQFLEDRPGTVWTSSGRLNIMASHALGRRSSRR